ncbi:MAG: hypothetical protein FWE09_07535 [Treponema sp.]|nr:hypothetical protein [Treponema sp.]
MTRYVMKAISAQAASDYYKTLLRYAQSGQIRRDVVSGLKSFLEEDVLQCVTKKAHWQDQKEYLLNPIPEAVISGIQAVIDARHAAGENAEVSELEYLYLLQKVAQTISFFSDVDIPMEVGRLFDVSIGAAHGALEKKSVKKSYKVGEDGPAGGIIFLDKGVYESGWRYLECAPHDIGPAQWGKVSYGYGHVDLKDEIGNGKRNTDQILKMFSKMFGNESGKAVHLCVALEMNGFKDWFLPNSAELNLMMTNLHKKGLGNFSNRAYWSSSAFGDGGYLHPYSYIAGENIYGDGRVDCLYYVRAARIF